MLKLFKSPAVVIGILFVGGTSTAQPGNRACTEEIRGRLYDLLRADCELKICENAKESLKAECSTVCGDLAKIEVAATCDKSPLN